MQHASGFALGRSSDPNNKHHKDGAMSTKIVLYWLATTAAIVYDARLRITRRRL